jgi:hypothetical protein
MPAEGPAEQVQARTPEAPRGKIMVKQVKVLSFLFFRILFRLRVINMSGCEVGAKG